MLLDMIHGMVLERVVGAGFMVVANELSARSNLVRMDIPSRNGCVLINIACIYVTSDFLALHMYTVGSRVGSEAAWHDEVIIQYYDIDFIGRLDKFLEVLRCEVDRLGSECWCCSGSGIDGAVCYWCGGSGGAYV